MSLYRPKNSKNWWIYLAHQGRRIRRSAGTPFKAQAQEYHDRVKADLWRAKKLGEHSALWEEAAVRWLEEKYHKKSIEGDRDKLRWLAPRLDGVRLDDIDRSAIDKIITDKRKEGVRSATINRHLAVVSGILNAAVEWGWLRAPLRIKKLHEPKSRERFLSVVEAQKLLKQLPPHLAAMMRFTLATGLREHNVTQLEWSQVDMRRKAAWVYGDQAKGKKPISIPLGTEALDVLRQQKGQHKHWVFVYKGHPVTKCTNHAWLKAVARAGLKGFRWHDLRHTWASWHVMAGTPPTVLQQLGGWSDLRMVMRYTHLSPGYLSGYADQISAYLRHTKKRA
jgi:integrase